ncbi:terminase small subunit protein [Stenotrophomonas sp.]|uniref:terminase small subunit-like protein n=1 Tax=Stenotrophomonas sp. TaxID=69392 RepID=UPI0028ACFA25|nr:terminase small subunit protein [Stenotrophomonas sp.]
MTGRPSDYSDEIAELICERIADGQSLKAICADEAMPGRSTVFRWLASRETFRDMYAHAREEQAETLADEIVGIADERETRVVMDGEGDAVVVFDSTAVARNRLRVDARKWVAAKLKPRKYGDKIQQEVSGPNGGPVGMVVSVTVNGVEPGSQ